MGEKNKNNINFEWVLVKPFGWMSSSKRKKLNRNIKKSEEASKLRKRLDFTMNLSKLPTNTNFGMTYSPSAGIFIPTDLQMYKTDLFVPNAAVRLGERTMVKGILGALGINVPAATQYNDDFTDDYNDDLARLYRVAYSNYVKKNGVPKPGIPFKLELKGNGPESTYKTINKDGTYARFNHKKIGKAALGKHEQVEFTDGGMYGTAVIDPYTGNVLINATDESSFDFDSGQQGTLLHSIFNESPSNAMGSAARYILGVVGKHVKYPDKLDFIVEIPGLPLEGNYENTGLENVDPVIRYKRGDGDSRRKRYLELINK